MTTAVEQKTVESPAEYKIAGMEVETMVADFLDVNYIQYPPVLLRRINVNGRRLYFYTDQQGEPQFFISVTSFIKAAMPTNPNLIRWIADKGYDAAHAYAEERAHYGTFLHTQIGDMLREGRYNMDALNDKLEAYVHANKLEPTFMNYAEELKKGVMSFAQFVVDVDFKPIATEIVLCNPDGKYAGALDHVGTMNIEEKGFWGEVYKSGAKKGKPKETKCIRRVLAIIDVKSGQNGFYEEHEVQLEAYRESWDYWFPDLPIEKLFNWSPKAWRGRIPTYNLKDQTGSISREKLAHIVALGNIDERKYDRRVVVISGEIVLDNGPAGLTENIREYGLAEIIKEDDEKRAEEQARIETEAAEQLEPLFPDDVVPTDSEKEAVDTITSTDPAVGTKSKIKSVKTRKTKK